ncbi:hypothetical protein TH25_09445 [Thalassospira profundimaris]|uniref:Uncharacterized protein n=1 Tax=Thalassospira profundimaris TaxID=502049 RepID=A0A367XBZ9_9PROT|nr:hypothetical protein [Thalassospira profundimaris]RCK51193.1 hypothetical protein TH25_09445 [Thalassospira profundimaris]
MRTVYQSTDDYGHVLRTLKLQHEDRTDPVYLGLVIREREVLFQTRESASRDFVLQKIKDFVASNTPESTLQPA